MHDSLRDRAATLRAMLHLLLLTGFCLGSGTAVRANAADAPRELHGMADAFAAPGIALAWGVVRGASEAATTVVVRCTGILEAQVPGAKPASHPRGRKNRMAEWEETQ